MESYEAMEAMKRAEEERIHLEREKAEHDDPNDVFERKGTLINVDLSAHPIYSRFPLPL